MNEKLKGELKIRMKVLGRVLFHATPPIIIVYYILRIWGAGISNDAEIEWNLFVTVACFGAAILTMLMVLFLHYILVHYGKLPTQEDEDK